MRGKTVLFRGHGPPHKGDAVNGRFVIQCKFTSKRDKLLSQSDLIDDAKKAKKLVRVAVAIPTFS
jgi:hypothetical protein